MTILLRPSTSGSALPFKTSKGIVKTNFKSLLKFFSTETGSIVDALRKGRRSANMAQADAQWFPDSQTPIEEYFSKSVTTLSRCLEVVCRCTNSNCFYRVLGVKYNIVCRLYEHVKKNLCSSFYCLYEDPRSQRQAQEKRDALFRYRHGFEGVADPGAVSAHVGLPEGQERQSSSKGKHKVCRSCGALNPNACRQSKTCGVKIEIKAFDWQKLKQKKKTHPTQQRKILKYLANVSNFQHGWHVFVLCLAKHKRGRSLYTYGTPGVGQQFLGSKREKVSKAGRLCLSLFKKFAKRKFRERFAHQDKTTVLPVYSNANKKPAEGPVTSANVQLGFPCPNCRKICKSSSGLKAHAKIHQ